MGCTLQGPFASGQPKMQNLPVRDIWIRQLLYIMLLKFHKNSNNLIKGDSISHQMEEMSCQYGKLISLAIKGVNSYRKEISLKYVDPFHIMRNFSPLLLLFSSFPPYSLCNWPTKLVQRVYMQLRLFSRKIKIKIYVFFSRLLSYLCFDPWGPDTQTGKLDRMG